MSFIREFDDVVAITIFFASLMPLLRCPYVTAPVSMLQSLFLFMRSGYLWTFLHTRDKTHPGMSDVKNTSRIAANFALATRTTEAGMSAR